MAKYIMIITAAVCGVFSACAQKTNETQNRNPVESTIKKQQIMDLSTITDPEVKMAVEALQAGDKSWYSFFTENPVMTDDGNTVNFKSFFANALGKEKFLTIDKVENNGLDIYGNFQAGQWGTFPVFFKFHKNSEGKFDRLDIGQNK
ncbi:MAG: hypothetical protein LBE92_03750 [Chryseobacterium sp.]|jgi:hypothetical protein|uniref:hypothetical protein n=1 Tax=Chryseobacterium sp. TaxID=1871047 RepID=UPI00281DC639|nr:hypothetical protein [Chryseobacterium sp.]MDR2235215.1 hypothetical protein [Chryseobacterium sp.]